MRDLSTASRNLMYCNGIDSGSTMSVRRSRPLAVDENTLKKVKFPSLPVAVGFPDSPGRAYVWQYQAEHSQYVERAHETDAVTYNIHRKHSLDSWKPVCCFGPLCVVFFSFFVALFKYTWSCHV